MFKETTVKTAGKKRVLNVRNDPIDIRDRLYEPALVRLKSSLDNRVPALVLDQGTEGACTGFGLAGVINLFKHQSGDKTFRASTRMLYEMAKKHDEWPGEDYAGSSCRGAIRGWHNMGVCEDALWPYRPDRPDADITVERAKNAKNYTLGAYYRLRPEVIDYHAALNITGAVYVSADVHEGWFRPKSSGGKLPKIAYPSPSAGGHAFAIVGYDRDGFIVQNSWGPSWGEKGFAIWTYEDWIENVMDGWVFRLALPTPQIFGLVARAGRTASEAEKQERAPVKRVRIAGHFVHFDDGRYKQHGDYWSTREDIQQTAALIARNKDFYKHILIFVHGGLNAPRASARRIEALKDGFLRNGVYPFHIMYDTGLAEELKDVIRRGLGIAEARAAGFTDWTDKIIEGVVRKPVTPIWEEMKRDARLPFEPAKGGAVGDGTDVIQIFAQALADTGISIHLAGHSTGGVLIGHLLDAIDGLGVSDVIASCSLLAPACTVDFYRTHYEPRLGRANEGPVVRLPKLTVYNLTDALEQDDTVATAYRKSLLYLVSRALEREPKKKVLGMQRYSKKLADRTGLKFVYSDGEQGRTTSTTHGGFDNDANTMNDILKSILGGKPPKPFTPDEMEGY